MLLLRDKRNMLQHRLEQMSASKPKPSWKKYDSRTIKFPVLSIQDVQNICLGKYLFMPNRNIYHNTITKETIKYDRPKAILSSI